LAGTLHHACIAIVDATRARLFTFEREATVTGLRDELTEVTDLVNPARRLRPSELFSETRPGTNRTGRLRYAFDDHRDAHLDQLDAEFARNVIAEIGRLLQTPRTDRLVLCASPSMLGELRDAADTLRRDRLVIDELPRDLVKLTPPQIRDHLADYGLLSRRPPRPVIARGA
jgi:protein required for attachment to host cells